MIYVVLGVLFLVLGLAFDADGGDALWYVGGFVMSSLTEWLVERR